MRSNIAAFLIVGSLSVTANGQEIRPGVWAAAGVDPLPVPMQGFQVYLVGEVHGFRENADFQLRYLERLHRDIGMRDVVIEERTVFEPDAQAYIDGRTDALTPHLCLRADMLDGLRRLNAGLKDGQRIRVHLADIDSPAFAIRRHLEILRQRLGAKSVSIPSESAIKTRGLGIVEQLKQFHPDPAAQSELRTVQHSIAALQQGLEFDLGPPKGVPYQESREEAIAGNIVDLIRLRGASPLLVIYGSDHISRAERRRFGGTNRDQLYTPMGLRLQRAGIKAFSLLTLPLDGEGFWRGQPVSLFWSPADANLASGETMDKVLPA